MPLITLFFFVTSAYTKVLIITEQHCCDACENVLCKLKDALTSTGLFKVSLDLCNLSRLAESVSGWYEQEFKNADRILVIASKALDRANRPCGTRKYLP